MNPLSNKKFLGAAAAALLSACVHTPPPGVSASLEPRSGSRVNGLVKFVPAGDKIRVEALVKGLAPGEYGFHIHEAGDCSAPDASSAKGHFNPGGKPHGYYGSPEHHAGDMPNLVADASGSANYVAEIAGVSLTTGPTGIIGRSVVVHAEPDDYRSQPAGNSGPRVACGVIREH